MKKIRKLSTHCVNGHEYKPGSFFLRRHAGKPRKFRQCKICYSDLMCRYYARLKRAVIDHYGGQCAWPGCDVVDIDILTLDHINNDGAADKKKFRGSNLYLQIRKRGYPEGFQVLCCNHNWKKEMGRRRTAREQGMLTGMNMVYPFADISKRSK